MSAFEATMALKGKGFAIICTDSHMQSHQIISIKNDEDKISEANGNTLWSLIGPSADRCMFSELVKKNMNLYELKNGVKLSPNAAATWTRNVLANALRKGPYQVETMIAGWNEEKGDAELYFIDAYASMAKLNKAAHSYGGNFCLGLLDKEYHPNMTLAEGKAAIKKCIEEVKLRFSLARMDHWTVKIVTKDGIQRLTEKDL